MHVAWAELLRRTFGVDILACPACDGRLRLVATITAPRVIAQILGHLGLPLEPPRRAAPRPPPSLPRARRRRLSSPGPCPSRAARRVPAAAPVRPAAAHQSPQGLESALPGALSASYVSSRGHWAGPGAAVRYSPGLSTRQLIRAIRRAIRPLLPAMSYG